MDQEHDRDVEIKLLRQRCSELAQALKCRVQDLAAAQNKILALENSLIELVEKLNAR